MTDFLYAMPSTLSGFARTLDLWGCYDAYNFGQRPEQTDAAALKMDSLALHNDCLAVVMEMGPVAPNDSPRDVRLIGRISKQ
jgi:hypothetical protein